MNYVKEFNNSSRVERSTLPNHIYPQNIKYKKI